MKEQKYPEEWKYPELIGKPNNVADITDEMMLTYEKEYEECNNANDLIKQELHEARESLLVTAALLFGANSNVVKYLKKQQVFSPSRFNFSKLERLVKEAKEERAIELGKIEKRREKNQLTEKAINWLIDCGKTLGVDFTLNGALSLANGIAFDEEVAKEIQRVKESGNFLTFHGDDACGECRGWDGERDRCECGSCRVTWKRSEFDNFFLSPIIYGQAY